MKPGASVPRPAAWTSKQWETAIANKRDQLRRRLRETHRADRSGRARVRRLIEDLERIWPEGEA